MDIEILKIAAKNKNQKVVPDFDFSTYHKNSICGDEIKITIKLKKDKICVFGYQTKSCVYCQASASLLSDRAKNESLDNIRLLVDLLKNYNNEFDINFPKKWTVFGKIFNKKNYSRKECLMLPIHAISKIIKK